MDIDSLPSPEELKSQKSTSIDVDSLPAPDELRATKVETRPAVPKRMAKPEDFVPTPKSVIEGLKISLPAAAVRSAIRAGETALKPQQSPAETDLSKDAPPPEAPYQPKTFGDKAGYLLGNLAGDTPLMAIAPEASIAGKGAGLIERALVPAANAVKTGLLGAGLGGAENAAQQYADTGAIDAKRVEHTAELGGLLGAAGSGAASTIGALASIRNLSPSRLAREALGGDAIVPQQPGQLLTETTPEARAAAAGVLNTQEGHQAFSELAAQRIRGMDTKIRPTLADTAAEAESLFKSSSTEANRAASDAVNNATRSAVDEKASVGTPTPAPDLGSKVQKQIAAKVEELQAQRKEVTDKMYEGAKQQAIGKPADPTEIVKELRKPQRNISVEEQAHLDKLAAGIQADLAENLGNKSSILDKDGKPLHTFDTNPNNNTVYDTLRAYDVSLGKIRYGNGDDAYKSAAAKAQEAVRKQLSEITKDANGTSLHDEARAAYHELSYPINKITGRKPAEKAIDEQDYINEFEQNPEKTLPQFIAEGKDGADVLQRALGDQAEPIVRSHFANEVQGASSSQIHKLAKDNSTFLSKFPNLNIDLIKAANVAAHRENMGEAAITTVKDQIAKLKPFNELGAKNAVQSLIGKGNVGRLKEFVETLKGQDPQKASRVGNDAVTQYFREKLDPIAARAEQMRDSPSSTANSLRSVINDWKDRRADLMDSGLITPEHGKALDAVFDDFDSFTSAAQHLPSGSEADGASALLSGIQAVGTHTIGYLGMKPLMHIANKIQAEGVNRIILRALADPAEAQRLARLKTGNPFTEFMKKFSKEQETLAKTIGAGAVRGGLQAAPGVTASTSERKTEPTRGLTNIP